MATKMTVKGVSTTTIPGQEQYEEYFDHILGGKRFLYDYRHSNGKNLFSCISKTLEEARAKRNNWVNQHFGGVK